MWAHKWDRGLHVFCSCFSRCFGVGSLRQSHLHALQLHVWREKSKHASNASCNPLSLILRITSSFTYVSMAAKDPVALGSVIGIMADTIGTPKQGHIALGSNDDEIIVSYVTGTTTTPSVRFGASETALNNVVTGVSTTYTASSLCGAPANQTQQMYFRNPGYMHTVMLSALAPSTTYYYQFGNSQDGWSDVYQFNSRFVMMHLTDLAKLMHAFEC